MNILTIEITNPKALNILTELAELHLIRFIKKDIGVKPKLSSLLRGSISPQAADEFNESVKKSRTEWERNI